jgi:autotransporter translocation and assembly factor TamB
MNEFTLLIEEWETDIQLLKIDLHRLASQASGLHALAEHRRLRREMHQARQAQALLYGLSQVQPVALNLAA